MQIQMLMHVHGMTLPETGDMSMTRHPSLRMAMVVSNLGLQLALSRLSQLGVPMVGVPMVGVPMGTTMDPTVAVERTCCPGTPTERRSRMVKAHLSEEECRPFPTHFCTWNTGGRSVSPRMGFP